MSPKVSIVILNYNHPEVIEICLNTLSITEGIEYEVVVVDNGSEPGVPERLREFKEVGLITTLVESPVNNFFSEGNNIGVRHSNSTSEYILLLNSDIGFLRSDWLVKLVAWMEGTIEYTPSIWPFHPTQPSAGPRDIVSAGWAHDVNVVPGNARPEGFCCLLRRSVWREMSPDFPFYYGFEEMVSNVIRDGAKCGVLSQYAKYFVHREGGSGKVPVANTRQPDLAAWMSGLPIETLDFTLGEFEHDSYMWW